MPERDKSDNSPLLSEQSDEETETIPVDAIPEETPSSPDNSQLKDKMSRTISGFVFLGIFAMVLAVMVFGLGVNTNQDSYFSPILFFIGLIALNRGLTSQHTEQSKIV